jgi:hypothetical protein
MPRQTPEPTVMPVDRETWNRQLHLSNFVNAYYQYRDLESLESCRNVLSIGPGQGFGVQVLRWRGYQVTTLDIDEISKPDYVGSVHDMKMFTDGQFDAAVTSHVLEHMAEPYLDTALQEIARIGRYALIYLPVHGRHVQLRFIPGFKGLDFSYIMDIFNYFEKPDGITPRYMSNQHFWEIGMRGFRVKDMVRKLSKFFYIISVYRNRDWLPSQNFVLKTKRI